MKQTAVGNPFSHSKAGPKILKGVSISRMADGSYSIRHEHEGYQHESEHHAAKTGKAMLDHVAKHMGADCAVSEKGK